MTLVSICVAAAWILLGKISVSFWEGFFETCFTWRGKIVSIFFAPLTFVVLLIVAAYLLFFIKFK